MSNLCRYASTYRRTVVLGVWFQYAPTRRNRVLGFFAARHIRAV